MSQPSHTEPTTQQRCEPATHRQLIEQRRAKVRNAELKLAAAKAELLDALADAADAGATWRELGHQLGVAASTVMRMVGHKRVADALDQPADRSSR